MASGPPASQRYDFTDSHGTNRSGETKPFVRASNFPQVRKRDKPHAAIANINGSRCQAPSGQSATRERPMRAKATPNPIAWRLAIRGLGRPASRSSVPAQALRTSHCTNRYIQKAPIAKNKTGRTPRLCGTLEKPNDAKTMRSNHNPGPEKLARCAFPAVLQPQKPIPAGEDRHKCRRGHDDCPVDSHLSRRDPGRERQSRGDPPLVAPQPLSSAVKRAHSMR